MMTQHEGPSRWQANYLQSFGVLQLFLEMLGKQIRMDLLDH